MRVSVCKIHCPCFSFCNPSQSICRGEELKSKLQKKKRKKSLSDQEPCSTEQEQIAEEEEGKEIITSSRKSSDVDHDDDDVDGGLQSCLRNGEVTKGNASNPKLIERNKKKKKKVQWMDFVGKPLFDIREFEPSSDSETDESEIHDRMNRRSCSLCSIL